MSRAVKWWPGWYVTRLHAVDAATQDHAGSPSVCGAWVYGPEHGKVSRPWQVKRIAAGVPECKRCLKVIARRALPHSTTGETRA